MTVNLDIDIKPGNVVENWREKGHKYLYEGTCLLIEKRVCRDGPYTFIYRQAVYGYECWLVEMSDGFRTVKRVYFRICEHEDDLPQEYTDQFTYNLEYPVNEDLSDDYGDMFNKQQIDE